MPVFDAKKNFLYIVNSIVSLGIMFGFGSIAPVPPLTEHGMALLGIFLGMFYGWLCIEIVWPSIVALLALSVVAGIPAVNVFHGSFGSPIVVMSFFIFIFCAVINHYGLSRYISLWLITRPFLKGRPWLFTLTFILSVMLLGGLTSSTPATLIGWGILYGICDICGYKKGDSYPTIMIIGLAFAGQFGMSLIPFKQAAVTVIGAFEVMAGHGIDYARYMMVSAICCVICACIFVALARWLFRVDVSRMAELNTQDLCQKDALLLNSRQKKLLFFLVLFMACLLTPHFLPADLAVTKLFRMIGNTGVCMLMVGLLCITRSEGEPLIDFNSMVATGVRWHVLFVLAAVMPLSAAMASPASGINPFILAKLEPLFGNSSPMFFAVCMAGCAITVTQFVNNGAVGMSLMPVIYSYCSAKGISPDLAIIMVVMSIHLALFMPSGSATAALLHGSDWVNSRTIWKTVPWNTVSAWLVIVGVSLITELFL